MIQNNNIYTINALKFDGKIHRSWKAEILENGINLISLKGIFEKEIRHPSLGVIRRGTVSYEYYWKTRWYNIFRFNEPTGELRNFYCNINQPPLLEDNVLNYVDLDIDVVVWKDFSYELLDMDEFEVNAQKFGYSPKLKEMAEKGLNQVLALIKNKSFPFDII